MFTFQVDKDIELRILEQADANKLYTVIDNNRRHLREWLPWVDGVTSPEDYHKIIADWRKQFADEDGFQAGIFFHGEIVGMIGFHGIDRRNRQTSIGYWLAEGHQGQGIMARACRALIDYAFRVLDLNRVEIRCATGNKKSRAIPERLGFKHEGTVRCGEWLTDHFVDSEVYGLLKNDVH